MHVELKLGQNTISARREKGQAPWDSPPNATPVAWARYSSLPFCRSLQVHKSGPRSTFKLFRALFVVQQHKAHRAKIKLCRRSIRARAVTDGNGQLWKVCYSLQRWFGIIKNTGQKRRRWKMKEQPKYNYSVLLDSCHGHQSGYFWLRYYDRR